MKIVNAAALFALVVSSGCTAPPAAPAPAPAASAVSEGISACQSLFARELACADTFLPVLIGLRIKHDLPQGIAERGKDAAGRAELLALAQAEFKVDAVDPARTQTCEKMGPALPADAVAMVRGCLQQTSCEALVDCVAPLHEQMLVR
ncbi:MAG TPA: hypothetical protein VMZ28_07555 [Kofleriaceae bacterium]|nr:hypothetical protein [Kofleriaceae bacterium]